MLSLAACSSARGAFSPVGDDSTVSTRAAGLTAGSYVALGDSYTSGPGIPDQVADPAGCQRSSNNYPAMVAEGLSLNADRTRDMSCSGATIADLSAPQSTTGGTNPAQFGALSSDTTLVTLGISGNDVDFAGVLTRCTEMGLIPALINGASQVSPCRAYYTSGGTDQIQDKIQSTAARLTAALAQIHQRAPHAHIYLVGYPELIPSEGAGCAHALGITQADAAFLNAEEQHLNEMLQQSARSADATYVDTYAPSVGHDACAASADRWIEPLLISSPAAPLHPNARGEQGMAEAVLHAIAAA
jgi:lysophospholipase L1-like esterase